MNNSARNVPDIIDLEEWTPKRKQVTMTQIYDITSCDENESVTSSTYVKKGPKPENFETAQGSNQQYKRKN